MIYYTNYTKNYYVIKILLILYVILYWKDNLISRDCYLKGSVFLCQSADRVILVLSTFGGNSFYNLLLNYKKRVFRKKFIILTKIFKIIL